MINKTNTTISLVVNTLNEEMYLDDCLKSCSWVDEIIVVDMHSTDTTREIALAAGAKVILTEPCGYVEPARNFALSQANCDWIILLDADERIVGSRDDIIALIEAAGDGVAAIQIKRVNHLGRWTIIDSGWGDDYQVRILKNKHVIWRDRIHSRPELLGTLFTATSAAGVYINHFNFPDLAGFSKKLIHYASKEPSSTENEWPVIIEELNNEFRLRYTPEADGALSFVLALQLVLYKLMVHAYSWERTGKMPLSPPASGSLDNLFSDRDAEVSRLMQTIVDREEQIAKLTRHVSTKQDEVRSLNEIIQSAREWQKRSLFKRMFHTWRPPHLPSRKVHLFKRFERSLRKRRNKLLGRSTSSFAQPAKTNENALRIANEIQIFSSNKPKVSIIIPIYGQLAYTLHCLKSIAEHPPKVEYEVIVVNDCSPDSSKSILEHVKGIQLINNVENLGFIRSSNAGVKAAKGEYLYFLNNDTQVTPGWLDELLLTFQRFPGTGLAGSKLVYPDGTLQEAGGIIWQDGSAWNFGCNQDPKLPLYNYAREVDYCSGASIMVPKGLFNELGGFDEHYLPAYCEDSDLALKIRDRGLRVIYQPMSEVIHFEGVSNGTDTSTGVKAYQVQNMKKVYERWKDRLAYHQPNAINVDNAKDRMAARRVLFLDQCTPTPDSDSGSIDAFNTMILMRDMGFQVTFIPVSNFHQDRKYTTAIQAHGIEALYKPYVPSVDQHLSEHGQRYELILACRYNTLEPHYPSLRKYCPNAKIIFHTVDLHFLRMQREADLKNRQKLHDAAKAVEAIELKLIDQCELTTVVSLVEHEVLTQMNRSRKVRVMPYSRKVRGTRCGFKDRKDLIFVGGFQHLPNIDAVEYFVADIMPLLREKLLGVVFNVVGSKVPQAISDLQCEDVVIHGFVEDLDSLLDEMRVSIAPLRYGAGIKGKIGSAMTVGLPVVATTMAAEGMALTPRENILVADKPEAIAEAIAELYKNEGLWNQLSTNGLAFAEKAWGAAAAWRVLHEILGELELAMPESKYFSALYNSNADSSG